MSKNFGGVDAKGYWSDPASQEESAFSAPPSLLHDHPPRRRPPPKGNPHPPAELEHQHQQLREWKRLLDHWERAFHCIDRFIVCCHRGRPCPPLAGDPQRRAAPPAAERAPAQHGHQHGPLHVDVAAQRERRPGALSRLSLSTRHATDAVYGACGTGEEPMLMALSRKEVIVGCGWGYLGSKTRAAETKGRAGSAHFVDVALDEQVRGMIESVVEMYGRLDVMVANTEIAGNIPVAESIDADSVTSDKWDHGLQCKG
ncbi:hypothetical protein B0H17DRAFT_1254648 [Mycena rosella]|uniref:Uncharacterized protein n=1 Tax=Mycena rosella TaxID=1033263 RepID=A0AAD7G499_MYCRO|nr:hypothetical protein B0H17DRAFT_1254648 [Mycena rosella]